MTHGMVWVGLVAILKGVIGHGIGFAMGFKRREACVGVFDIVINLIGAIECRCHGSKGGFGFGGEIMGFIFSNLAQETRMVRGLLGGLFQNSVVQVG